MALVGVTEAARLTGKSRATLYRKMQSGVLSHTKGNENEALLETSELIRVFGSLRQNQTLHSTADEAHRNSVEMQLLQSENARLMAELQTERTQKELLQANVQDLRRAMLLLENKSQIETKNEPLKLTKKQKKSLIK